MTEVRRDYVVYVHYRKSNPEIPFYVGKASGNRPNSMRSRNPHWHNIVKKDGGFIVEIERTGLTEEEAHEIETELIQSLGRTDNGTGILANKTNGGEGASGAIMPETHKISMRQKAKALWRQSWFRAVRFKSLSERNKRQWQDPVYREKKTQENRKIWDDPAYRERISQSMSVRNKQNWQDPKYRQQRAKNQHAYYASEKYKEFSVENKIGKPATPWHEDKYVKEKKGKLQVEVYYNNRNIYIGRFDCITAARAARDEWISLNAPTLRPQEIREAV